MAQEFFLAYTDTSYETEGVRGRIVGPFGTKGEAEMFASGVDWTNDSSVGLEGLFTSEALARQMLSENCSVPPENIEVIGPENTLEITA